MQNLSNWLLNRGGSAQATEDLLEAVAVLKKLRDNASPVSVALEGAPGFESAITALNTRHRVLIIDAPPESVDIPGLCRGRPLTLTAKTEAQDISFRSSFIEPFMPDVSMGLQVAMPVSLGFVEARGALRVLLDELQQSVRIMLLPSTNDPVCGRVTNISREGLGLKTHADLPSHIHQGNGRVDCEIALTDSDNISCQVEICNVRQGNGSLGTYIGGRMLGISRRDYDRLSEFIEQLQEKRRHALAVEGYGE